MDAVTIAVIVQSIRRFSGCLGMFVAGTLADWKSVDTAAASNLDKRHYQWSRNSESVTEEKEKEKESFAIIPFS